MKKGAPRTRKGWKTALRHRWRKLLRSVVVIDDTPHRVALGIAIGTFVAYQPIVGIQMITGAVVAGIVRANVIATLPPAWITNPVTILPIYYGLYRLGALFTGGARSMHDIREILSHIEVERETAGLWASIELGFRELANGFLLPMAIGGFIVGLLNALLFYWLTKRAVAAYQHHKVRKRLAWLHLHQGEPGSPEAVGTSWDKEHP